jgi:hypothetical protein
MKNSRILMVVLIVGAILLIPLIAMQFSEEVVWTASDFLVAAVLLLGAGLAIDFVLRKISTKKNRIILCGIILGILLILWAELAVGVFGTPFAGS